MTIRTAETLPILDFRTLTDDQLAAAKDIFDDFRDRDLMPAYLAAAEPSVHGGKKRPRNATLII